MRADFNRSTGAASANGITMQPRVSVEKGGDVTFPLCRALVAAGAADETLEFFDERGMHCFTVDSVHAGARTSYSETDRGLRRIRYVPFDKSKVAG